MVRLFKFEGYALDTMCEMEATDVGKYLAFAAPLSIPSGSIKTEYVDISEEEAVGILEPVFWFDPGKYFKKEDEDKPYAWISLPNGECVEGNVEELDDDCVARTISLKINGIWYGTTMERVVMRWKENPSDEPQE